MAMSSLRLTVEEKNYWKFCMLNVRVVPDALRNYFDSLIPSTGLATTITRYSSTILNLVTWKVINAAQLNILQRIPGTIWPPKVTPVSIGSTDTSSAHFDVTLMVCLLRNIPLSGIFPPVTGWDHLPYPHDKSPGAYLARIKYYRNEIAHSTEHNMNTLDFHDKWQALSEAVKFFNGGHSPTSILEILHCDLDGSYNGDVVLDLSTEIDEIKRDLTLVEAKNNQMKKDLTRTELQLEHVRSDFELYKDGSLPKNISDTINNLISQWWKDDEVYFVTRATKQVYDMLESENIILIIGHSGAGKSATARNVALTCHSNGYDVVPVESVYNILDYRCKDKKQIFVIDDVVGKYSINGTCLYQWERLDSKLMAVFVDPNAKLICTLRKVLATDPKFRQTNTLFNKKAYVIDLDHQDNYLLSEEKMSVLKNHLNCTGRQNDLSDEERKECCKANFAFPLLCNVFTTSSELFKRKSSFFRKPLCYVNGEIAKLHKRNKEVYCSLVICMIYSGKLSTDIFSVSDDSREEQNNSGRILGIISEACGLNRNISRQTLLDSLHSVEGVYINMSFGKINFVHDFFLEAISFHFSKVNICVLLKCCDNDFLMQRVRVISPNVNDDQNVKVLEEKSYFHLACRFIDELKKGSFFKVLWSQPIKKHKFLNVMFNLIDRGDMITKQELIKSKLSRQNVGDWNCFTPVIRNGVQTTIVVFPSEKTFLHWVVCHGCHNFFDYFWKSMSKKEQKRFVCADRFIFPISVLSGCKEIINQMFEAGADVKSPESQYALQILVNTEKNTELIKFLVRNGIEMNFTDHYRKSPFYYAITNKRLTIQAFLVEEDSKQNPLLEAVFHSNILKTKELLSYLNIRLVSNNSWSVFHFAAYNNDIAMFEMIFETAMKRCRKLDQNILKTLKISDILYAVNKTDKSGWTPLHLASVLCKYEAVDFLIRKDANINLVDLDGNTPLHLSSSRQITASLLRQNHFTKELPHEECLKTINDERHLIEDDPFVKDFPKILKKWQHSVISLFYVTCMNILFFCFSIVKLRKTIDIPDNEGNTLLHAAAAIENQDESIESAKMLLERGANPLFYNNLGYLPADIALLLSSYKVKRFLDMYTMHAAKRSMWVLVIISILTFLLVIFLCLSPLYISHGIANGDADIKSHTNFNSYNYSNNLNIDVCPISYELNSLAQENETAKHLHANLPLLYIIHLLSIVCVLSIDIVLAVCKKLLWRQNCFFEIIYMGVHLITLSHVVFICFPSRPIWIVLKDMIVVFLLIYLFVIGCGKFAILIQTFRLEWLLFTSRSYKFVYTFCIILSAVSLCVLYFDVMFLSRILFMPGNSFNFSMMSLFSAIIFTIIGIYIYMNVCSASAYLIFQTIWGKSHSFRQFTNRLQFKHPNALFNLIDPNLLTSRHIIFKFLFLFFLLFIETINFYDAYQNEILLANLLNKSNLFHSRNKNSFLYNFIAIIFDTLLLTLFTYFNKHPYIRFI